MSEYHGGVTGGYFEEFFRLLNFRERVQNCPFINDYHGLTGDHRSLFDVAGEHSAISQQVAFSGYAKLRMARAQTVSKVVLGA